MDGGMRSFPSGDGVVFGDTGVAREAATFSGFAASIPGFVDQTVHVVFVIIPVIDLFVVSCESSIGVIPSHLRSPRPGVIGLDTLVVVIVFVVLTELTLPRLVVTVNDITVVAVFDLFSVVSVVPIFSVVFIAVGVVGCIVVWLRTRGAVV